LESSRYCKSYWDHDLLSWCFDYDPVQRTRDEKFMASSNPHSTEKCCYHRRLVKGFDSYSCKLCCMVFMVHYAGFHLNSTSVYIFHAMHKVVSFLLSILIYEAGTRLIKENYLLKTKFLTNLMKILKIELK